MPKRDSLGEFYRQGSSQGTYYARVAILRAIAAECPDVLQDLRASCIALFRTMSPEDREAFTMSVLLPLRAGSEPGEKPAIDPWLMEHLETLRTEDSAEFRRATSVIEGVIEAHHAGMTQGREIKDSVREWSRRWNIDVDWVHQEAFHALLHWSRFAQDNLTLAWPDTWPISWLVDSSPATMQVAYSRAFPRKEPQGGREDFHFWLAADVWDAPNENAALPDGFAWQVGLMSRSEFERRTVKRFSERLRQYCDEREERARSLGLQTSSVLPALESHAKWYVRFQVGRQRWVDISNEEKLEKSHTVWKAVHDFVDRFMLPLRASTRG